MNASAQTRFRAFLAIDIPDEIRRALTTTQGKLKQERAHVGWVLSHNFHVSLAFLGDILTEDAEIVTEIMDQATRAALPFPLVVSQLGTFGRPRSPRTIWAGIEASQSLTRLQEMLVDPLHQLGLHQETRPFHAHVTLGRVRSARGRQALSERITKLEQTSFGQFTVTTVILMKSALTPDGPIYTPHHKAPLLLDNTAFDC